MLFLQRQRFEEHFALFPLGNHLLQAVALFGQSLQGAVIVLSNQRQSYEKKNAQNQYHHSLKKKAASKEGRGQMFNINTTLANYLSQTCRKHVRGRICKQNVVADIVHSKKYKTVCKDD